MARVASDGPWARAKEIVRLWRRGEQFDRGEEWLRQQKRIAHLPKEIGEELDRVGASTRDARHVACGATGAERQRRLLEIAAKHEPQERPIPVLRQPTRPSVVKRLNLELPPSLLSVPRHDVEELLEEALRRAG